MKNYKSSIASQINVIADRDNNFVLQTVFALAGG